jgi:hypothetical protein
MPRPKRGGREADEIGRPSEGGTRSGSPSELTLGGVFSILSFKRYPMEERKPDPGERLSDLRAKFKEKLQKFEELRGFL